MLQKKIEIEHIKRLDKKTQLLIFDSGIVVELNDKSDQEDKTLTFSSFENRDEVLECITAIWQAQVEPGSSGAEDDDDEDEDEQAPKNDIDDVQPQSNSGASKE